MGAAWRERAAAGCACAGHMSGLVAVTGATGFVGRHLVVQLLADGWRVRALVRRPEPELEAAGVQTIAGSIDDSASLSDLVVGADALVHGAGVVFAQRRREFMAINAGGTRRLMDAVRHGSGTPRLVLISSLAAREPHLSAYAASKRQAEEIVANSGPGPDWCIVRPPAVYGGGDRMTLPLFRQFTRGFAFVPAGEEARFSLLYVVDLAAAIARLVSQTTLRRAILEIDDGRPAGYTWSDLIGIGAHVLRRPLRRIPVWHTMLLVPAALGQLWPWLPANRSGGLRVLTPGKLRELFHPDWVCRPERDTEIKGWTPRIGFEEGFALTLAWYRRQGWL